MDMVIFEVRGGLFAYPATDVLEVREPMAVTALPFAPSHVDGLVNVAGRVVPQMDAARRMGLDQAKGACQELSSNQGNVILLQIAGEVTAVHIDRVVSKVTLAEQDIAWSGQSDDKIEALRGEFIWNGRTVLLLHSAVFSLGGIHAVHVPTGSAGLLGSAAALNSHNAPSARKDAENRLLCLVFQSGRERYALALEAVQEIVQGSLLTALPHAPPEVAGMSSLRGQALLTLSMAAMLGQSSAPSANQDMDTQWMVVVSCRGLRFGLLTDSIVGIQSFDKETLQSVEHGAADSDKDEIAGYLIGQGETMVALLRLEQFISEQRMRHYRQFLVKHQGDADTAATKAPRVKRRFLSFRVGREYCAIALESVQRVQECSAPVVSGVVQIAGQIVPVIDLRLEWGSASQAGSVAGPIKDAVFLVVRHDGDNFALLVDKVERVVEIALEDIEPVQSSSLDFIASVGRLDERLISILSLAPLKQEVL